MITKIGMTNVKGQTTEQQLTGKDLIIGRNGAGKTTRLQTIGLAMLGYVPGKGKTANDTFKLASADEMKVTMQAGEFELSRTFKKDKKLKADGSTDVKISQKISVSPSQGESSNKQKEQRIKAEVGDFPAMLDFGSFIGMTDNQQRDFIYELSGSGFSWDRSRVEEELKRVLLDPRNEENNRDLYSVMSECVKEAMAEYREGTDIQDGILAMAEYAKTALSHWKKEKTKADGASQKLTELKNQRTQTDRDLNENQEKLKALGMQREELIKQIAKIDADNNTINARAGQLRHLKSEIESMAAGDTSEREAELKTAIDRLGQDIVDTECRLEELRQQMDARRNEAAVMDTEYRQLGEAQMEIEKTIARYEAKIAATDAILQKIATSNGCCAFSPNIACRQDFSEFIQESQSTIDDAYDAKDLEEDKKRATESARSALREKMYDNKSAQENIRKAMNDSEAALTAARRAADANRRELVELQGREPAIAAKRQQEAEIEAFLEEHKVVDTSQIEADKKLLESQMESLQNQIDEQKRVRNELATIKANIIDSQTAEYKVLCWTQISKALGQGGIKGAMVKEMLDPMMREVNEKLNDIGIDEEFYFSTNSDTGKEIFEFGWSNKPFAALSTGEQLLLMTALMTTIIERSNTPLKVLAIDNINDLDRHNLALVLKGLNTIGKNMDNIILAGVVEPTEEDSEGWEVWRL